MDTLRRDELSVVVMNLDLPDLLSLCESSKELKNKVCNNPNVWYNKLDKDYPEYKELDLSFLSHPSFLSPSPKEMYVFMYQLDYIKKLLNTKETLKDIFLRKGLDLSNKKLKKIPAFNLPNLKILYLSDNHLTEVPNFDNLPNLQTLSLTNNKLTEVPNFNLPNLQTLYLFNNELTEVPNFNLPSLQTLYLEDNKLTEVPNFNLPSLQELYLFNNQLTKVPNFNLPSLQTLFLSNNRLTQVPNFNLPSLQTLFLSNNRLTEESKEEIKKRYKFTRL